MSIEELLMSKVEMVTETGCWIYMGSLAGGTGYGLFGPYRRLGFPKKRGAHRVSYEKFRGPIPKDKQIDHICRTPACVNPWHLRIVTSRENTLLGNSHVAARVAQSKCKRGHAFDSRNTRWKSNGSRNCRQCDKLHEENRKSKRKVFPPTP